MPLYRYHSISDLGKKIRGIIDADSLTSAKEKLRKDHILITDIALLDHQKRETRIPFSSLLDFTRILEQLLLAGIPLYESLIIIEEKYRRHRFHPILIDFCDALKTGIPLSEALRRYPKTFTPVYTAMVKAGEEAGNLSDVFKQLCLLLKRQEQLKKQLFSAAAYPLFLGCFCLLVFFILLLFVVPSMKLLFEGKSLHPMTQFIFFASDTMIANLTSLIIGTGCFAAVFTFFLRYPPLKFKFDAFFLKIPVIGKVITEAAMIRFCHTASLLLLGGIPILKTLQLARKVIKNQVLEGIIIQAEQRANEGKVLSEEFRRHPRIPSILPRMLSIAEETGKIGFMLQNIATICEETLEKRVAWFIAILQPALLLLLGLIIGVVLLSILIPLTDVGSVLQP